MTYYSKTVGRIHVPDGFQQLTTGTNESQLVVQEVKYTAPHVNVIILHAPTFHVILFDND